MRFGLLLLVLSLEDFTLEIPFRTVWNEHQYRSIDLSLKYNINRHNTDSNFWSWKLKNHSHWAVKRGIRLSITKRGKKSNELFSPAKNSKLSMISFISFESQLRRLCNTIHVHTWCLSLKLLVYFYFRSFYILFDNLT